MINNFINILNFAIARDDDLHTALKGLAGKRLRVVLPIGGSLDCEIEADGLLKEFARNAQHLEPHVTIIVQSDITKGLRIEGDAVVAERLSPLARVIKDRVSPWERFWNNSMAGAIAKQVAEYAIHESDLMVSRGQAQAHHEALRQFRDALDRLEKRIEAIERR
jgi:ubiquinone biosynthesis protein UbiJ